MLDAKVLAAVFASLTAVATTMNGGSFQPDMAVNGVSTSLSDTPDFAGTGSTLDMLRNVFTTRPEPTNDVSATLTLSNLENEEIKVQKSSIAASGLKEIKLGSKKMSSDSDIVFEGFKGNIQPGDPTNIKGTTNSVISSGVNISGRTKVSEKVNSSQLNIQENGRAKISLSSIQGQINSGSASTEFSDGKRKLDINSFSGEITIYPDNSTLILNGKVDELNAGSFSFGG
jgi:hypothetical protein